METSIHLQDFLLVIAQVSVTLGGFAGLVKVFAPGEKFDIRDAIGLRLIIEHTFAALFAALLPLLIWYSWQPAGVWRIASVPVAVFLAYELVSQMIKIARQTQSGWPPRHPWALRLHFLPGTMLFFLLMVANVWRWHSGAVYAWTLVWLLNPPCFQLFFSCFLLHSKTNERSRRA